ncbi:MAG TPA: hypothetical protein VJK02_24725 [Anaerolineales bacterium]|nr:hypothetical protein [Anaerolineales bacterium]
MKHSARVALVAVLAAILSSCADSASPPADGMIQPGDKVGEFSVTRGEGEDVVYMTMQHCPYDSGSGMERCAFSAGTHVNVAEGIYDDDPTGGKSLDAYWTEQTHEMVISGRRVNLEAFGYVDLPHPTFGTIRVWNVVVTSDKPGELSARSTGVVGGDPFDYTGVVTFTSP